jgi:membrane protein implicated in regulation of membrane protease activity
LLKEKLEECETFNGCGNLFWVDLVGVVCLSCRLGGMRFSVIVAATAAFILATTALAVFITATAAAFAFATTAATATLALRQAQRAEDAHGRAPVGEGRLQQVQAD